MKINIIRSFLIVLLLNSCASKSDILYLHDAEPNTTSTINYQTSTIQPNDILKIAVKTLLVPEAAIPYNKNIDGTQTNNIQSEGYLVSIKSTIDFPFLGEINVAKKTTKDLEIDITDRLVKGRHLINPMVNVCVINAKFTVLGEVNNPGTYNFTEQSIPFLQALGYAGDLTINGKRNNIKIIREVDGVRRISYIDITLTEFMNSEFYYVKPNDIIYVNPNDPKVKSAGFIGNLGTAISVVSSALALVLLLTR